MSEHKIDQVYIWIAIYADGFERVLLAIDAGLDEPETVALMAVRRDRAEDLRVHAERAKENLYNRENPIVHLTLRTFIGQRVLDPITDIKLLLH